jgi:hypothetical protein
MRSTRREFTKTLAATLTAAALPKGGAAEPIQQAEQDRISKTADALAEAARIRYGEYMNEDQFKEVKRSIDRALRAADRIKQFKLKNGDEPAFIFSADL